MTEQEMTDNQKKAWNRCLSLMRDRKINYIEMAEAFEGVQLKVFPWPDEVHGLLWSDITDVVTGEMLATIMSKGGVKYYNKIITQ